MGLYSEGFTFRLKIKFDLWGIFEFLWWFTVFVAYPFLRICPYITKV